ncbi:hypothetical protein [Arthrobacter sp. MMS18-M83]|uniref:hypothetical protein n=1 Tax=Arthrobacter sp. MMS18-M83 TaxID=2996261 RepID=UPI00227AE700|nr:hypothetical protein [Arthrobacter sp. MMS18-M83]WAH97290.1 hypothetical protein OW521_23615 [Arthrobacter sp. MMS18-M83]
MRFTVRLSPVAAVLAPGEGDGRVRVGNDVHGVEARNPSVEKWFCGDETVEPAAGDPLHQAGENLHVTAASSSLLLSMAATLAWAISRFHTAVVRDSGSASSGPKMEQARSSFQATEFRRTSSSSLTGAAALLPGWASALPS